MNFRELTHISELEALDKESEAGSVVIFKHSTRCPISSMAYSRLTNGWDLPDSEVPVYYLDIIRHRDVSNEITQRYDIRHESPQVLVIQNGEVVYDNSHHGITVSDLKEKVFNA